MKHIKKKFLLAKKIMNNGQDGFENEQSANNAVNNIIENNHKDYRGYLLSSTGYVIQTFKFEKDGETLFVPEPNPIVIYFSNAQMFLAPIVANKKALIDNLNQKGNLSETQNLSYVLFGHCSNFVTSLFNALEAFMNSKIPFDCIYESQSLKHPKNYNKQDLQKYMKFREKIKKVIPKITGKSFHREFGHKYDVISNFKGLRDNVAHTKEHEGDDQNYYQKLFSDLLNHNYLESIEAIRDYINFYEPNLIEPCSCGKDH